MGKVILLLRLILEDVTFVVIEICVELKIFVKI